MIQKQTNYLPWAIVLVLLFTLWFKNCKGDSGSEPVTITTPEVNGKFDSEKPKHTIISTEPSDLSTGVKPQNYGTNDAFLQEEINKLLQQNDQLGQAYASATDSLKLAMFTKAIELNNFAQTYDDQYLKADISGIVRGEVESIKLEYKIKSQTIEVPKQKEVVFRLMGGIEAGNNAQFNSFNAKVNIGFQNRKGGIISISADTDKKYYIGYTIPIFSIKGK